MCEEFSSDAKISYSLFMCQDEDENEDEDQRFGLFWKYCMTNEPIQSSSNSLIRSSQALSKTNENFCLWFIFVFVLAHEQPIIATPQGIEQVMLQ